MGRIVFFTAVLMAFTACSTSFEGDGVRVPGVKANQSADITDGGSNQIQAKKHPEDSKRPTDSSEGIPGYLIDPAMVEIITNESDETKVVGKPKAAKGFDSGSSVYVYKVDRKDFEKPWQGDEWSLPVRELGRSTVESDGSFSVSVIASPLTYLVLSSKQLVGEAVMQDAAGYGVVSVHDTFQTLDKGIDWFKDGFSLLCAKGQFGGTNSTMILNFDGHLNYTCGDCSANVKLEKSHPLANVVTDGRACKLLSAEKSNNAGFFKAAGGAICSRVGSKCELESRFTFLPLLGKFESAKSLRSAFNESKQECKNFYADTPTSILDILTPSNASCDGVRTNVNGITVCQVPPARLSIAESQACLLKSVYSRFLGKKSEKQSERCDVYAEKIATCN